MKKIASMIAVMSMLGFFSSFSLGLEDLSQDGYMVNEECACKRKKTPVTIAPPPPPPPAYSL